MMLPKSLDDDSAREIVFTTPPLLITSEALFITNGFYGWKKVQGDLKVQLIK